MILVDTSVWIDHLRHAEHNLSVLLDRHCVIMHPMIVGELACGNLKDRSVLLNLWASLPVIPTVSDREALYFLERNRLMGKGIGFVDLHLLASVSLSPEASLWTQDKRLQRIAGELDLAFSEDLSGL